MIEISKPKLSARSGQNLKKNKIVIYSLSCVLSMVLFFAYSATDSILNDDGMNYIYAAHSIAEGLPEQAKSYRPETLFYSQIALTANFTGLDLYPSAQLLSLFLQALLACGFIAIIRSFDTSMQSQLIALGVFFSMMSLNDLRPEIIRGFGFWALQLWAVWAGLAFIKSKLWRFALLWLGLSGISILYRAEGLVYLALIPMLILLNTAFTGKFTAKKGLKTASLILIVSGVIWFVFVPESRQPSNNTSGFTQLQSLSVTGKLQRELRIFKQGISKFRQLKTDIAKIMPNKWAQRSANNLLIGGFTFHLLLILIKTSNAPLMILSLYRGNIKRPFFSDPRHKLLASYILTGILIGLMSIYNKYFLSTRYIMLTAILLGIPITLVLNQSYSRFITSHKLRARLWRYALFSLPLLACIYPLTRQDDNKLYIREAGQWVKTHLKDEQIIYFNDQKVAFYTADYANDSFKKQHDDLQDLLREGYQYAVLYEGKGEQPPLQQSLQELRLKSFKNSRGRSVNIYKLPAPDS
ncbi:MAG: hypothetical protein AB9Q20_04570 [Candidatus Reddybacter sp.]